MSNVLTTEEGKLLRYFPFPEAWMEYLTNLSGVGVKLAVVIAHLAQRNSAVELNLQAKKIRELSGLCPNSVTKGLRDLDSHGFIRRTGRSRIALLDPATGRPLPPFREQKRLREIGQQVDSEMRGDSAPARRRTRSVFNLTRAEYKRYYEARLNQKIADTGADWVDVYCQFHADTRPSLSVCLSNGVWLCHVPSCPSNTAENADKPKAHSILEFERRFSACSDAEAVAQIAKLANAPDVRWTASRKAKAVPVASYDYADEQGTVLYSIHRYQPKSFRLSRLTADGRTVWNMKGVRKVLYRLPDVLAASTVILTEGEKDADRVRSLGLLDSHGQPCAVTTAPFGCKWDSSYSACLFGKRVVICVDNDDAGMSFADAVRDSLQDKADVQLIMFSELPEHSDVSDYLEQHSAQELVEKIGSDRITLLKK